MSTVLIGYACVAGIVILAIIIVIIESCHARKEASENRGEYLPSPKGPTEEEIRAFREREDKIIKQTMWTIGGSS